jgi:hypothetical protein
MNIRRTICAVSVLIVVSACGASTTSDTSSESESTELSEAPQSNSDFCKNAALATTSMESVLSEENSEKSPEESWQAVLSYASKMLENAPDEIENEARRLQKGISDYAAVLAKYDYDFVAMAANPDVVTEVEAIDKDGSMTKASEAVDAYLENKCGIPQGS